MAWGQLDICGMGCLAWGDAGLSQNVPAWRKGIGSWRIHAFSGTLLTFLCVMFGWIFFRAANFSQAFAVIHGMLIWQEGVCWCNPFIIGTMFLVLLWHIPKALKWDKFMELPFNSVYSYTVLFSMVWMIIIFHPTEFTPFVYGSF